MSPLGKLLRGIRLNKNISELKAARRAELPIEEYNSIERRPEQAPAYMLYKVFKAIEISGQEYFDFSTLALQLYYRRPSKKKLGGSRRKAQDILSKMFDYQSKSGVTSSQVGSVLEFADKRGLSYRRPGRKKFEKKEE